MAGETQTFEFSVAADQARLRAWHGEQPTVEDAHAFINNVVVPATRVDPVVFRAYQRHFHVLSPANELLGNPDVVERACRAASSHNSDEPVMPRARHGPDRLTGPVGTSRILTRQGAHVVVRTAGAAPGGICRDDVRVHEPGRGCGVH